MMISKRSDSKEGRSPDRPGGLETAAPCELKNRSADFGGVAIQGPKVVDLFVDLPARNHIVDVELAGMPVSIARTGYTGEDGVEVFFRASDAAKFWNTVLEKGQKFGIKPCGLGFFVDLTKPKFIGRDVLLKVKENGPAQKLVPFRMQGKGPPPRPHYSVFNNSERIGEVTSGTLSPSLNYGVGMAYINAHSSKIGTKIDIEIRENKFPAIIEKKPLYKKP